MAQELLSPEQEVIALEAQLQEVLAALRLHLAKTVSERGTHAYSYLMVATRDERDRGVSMSLDQDGQWADVEDDSIDGVMMRFADLMDPGYDSIQREETDALNEKFAQDGLELQGKISLLILRDRPPSTLTQEEKEFLDSYFRDPVKHIRQKYAAIKRAYVHEPTNRIRLLTELISRINRLFSH